MSPDARGITGFYCILKTLPQRDSGSVYILDMQ
jgi:hypothetical protein